MSAIVAMSNKGMLDFHLATGGVLAETFDNFVNKALLPQLQPFDGVNSCSIVVLDNAAIHHASVMLPYARSAGCLIYFFTTLQSGSQPT